MGSAFVDQMWYPNQQQSLLFVLGLVPGSLAPSQLFKQQMRTYKVTPPPELIEPPGVPSPQIAPEALPETPWGKIARDTADLLFEALDSAGVVVDIIAIINPRLVVPGSNESPSPNPNN